jgi:protein-arginine kinase
MEERESIGLLSDIKLGVDTGILQVSNNSPEDNNITPLLFRVKCGHMELLLKNGNFSFENDVAASETMQINRLRALVMQEAVEGLSLS